MKVISIVGARPQFIKAAPVSRALRALSISEILVHTGQHYDDIMSDVFFRELEMPRPDHNLEIGSGLHGWQTGQMLAEIEKILLSEKPDWVIVYGDTNSTLAGALAAVKLIIPLAHVESGLRSYNNTMPEEHNRVLTDHCSNLLFCPTRTAVQNLTKEGITQNALLVGDTMVDSILLYSEKAKGQSRILESLGLESKGYSLATVHRAENTNSSRNLKNLLEGLIAINEPIVFPVHPRTKKVIDTLELGAKTSNWGNLRMIEPVGYLDMLILERNARMILTDSGGIQKEAYIFRVPCVTLRDETEWIETVESGWNRIAGTQVDGIVDAACSPWELPVNQADLFGDGDAAGKIARAFFEKK